MTFKGVLEADMQLAKSKKQRQLAARAALKAAKANQDQLGPKIPLEHQSIDLPAGDGTTEGSIQAVEARHELTGALRKSRRKLIKETNFLKTMR
jgi:large subunit ribosomal protein L54